MTEMTERTSDLEPENEQKKSDNKVFAEYTEKLDDLRIDMFNTVSSLLNRIFPKKYKDDNGIHIYWKLRTYCFAYAELFMQIDGEYVAHIMTLGEKEFCTWYNNFHEMLAENPYGCHSDNLYIGNYRKYAVYLRENPTEDDIKKFIQEIANNMAILRVWVNHHNKLSEKVNKIDTAFLNSLSKLVRTEIRTIKE